MSLKVCPRPLKFSVLLLLIVNMGQAENIRLDYVGILPSKPLKANIDTTRSFDMFQKFVWGVKTIDTNGNVKEYSSKKIDTLDVDGFDLVNFSTTFTVSEALLHKVYYFHFVSEGSLKFVLNNIVIFSSGQFDKTGEVKKKRIIQNEYMAFTFSDTLQKIDIHYIPRSETKVVDLKMAMGQEKWAKQRLADAKSDENESFALGFYYLAFGIVFVIMFLFFREKIENLYFSMFCLSTSLAFLWSNFNIDLLDSQQDLFFTIFALEFLSIFFAKVIKNRDRSKIPLLLIFIIFLLTFLKVVRYNYSFFPGTKQAAPIILIVIFVTLILYTIFSSLYYLIQGFGQRRWEAKTIVAICSIGFVIFFIVPLIIGIAGATGGNIKVSLAGIMSDIGLCIYPLSAAIVLGRRNGMNQKELISQINWIENLSNENLAREKEKKALLENQNSELERKVNLRTQEVMHQKEEIEIKNKAITDNLNYAQRIQSAILPQLSTIKRSLPDSFVVFYPKDIVSGDFYVFISNDKYTFLVAGDCTGHGVSGAFMSMIGSSQLFQIINERGINEPAEILNHLNTAIIETFRQTVSGSNDGMDVALCRFDLTNNELQFAGANRPLWFVRNGELEVIKPDKAPIGGLQMAKERTFTNYTTGLEKNDSIYIFTDGYADQFGGEKGKKMMTAKFKEMILSVQQMSMHEQGEYLKKELSDWKGNHEQVDDVLVMGVRI